MLLRFYFDTNQIRKMQLVRFPICGFTEAGDISLPGLLVFFLLLLSGDDIELQGRIRELKVFYPLALLRTKDRSGGLVCIRYSGSVGRFGLGAAKGKGSS